MDEKRQIYMEQLIPVSKETQEYLKLVNDWFLLIRILEEPEYCIYEENVFPIDKDKRTEWMEAVKKAFETPDTSFSLAYGMVSDHLESWIDIGQEMIFLRAVISEEIFQTNQSVLEDFIRQQMRNRGAYHAFLRDYQEFLYHNLSDKEERKKKLTIKDNQKLPEWLDEEGNPEIDCSRLSGFNLVVDRLFFTSCWKMWYSSVHFQLIPSYIFRDIQQVEDVILDASQEIVEITLYEDPFNWRHPANLHFQFLFREQIGCDQFNWQNGVGVMRDPFIELIYSPFGVQTIQYKNTHLQPVHKKKAQYFLTKMKIANQAEKKEIVIQNHFGELNSLAFFPWRNEQKKIMMNYLILDLSQQLHHGAESLTYYIRYYLDVDLQQDEKYKEYQPVLQLFFDSKSLEQVPYAALHAALSDKVIKEEKVANGTYMDLKHGENRLIVQFLDYNDLKSLQKEFVSVKSPEATRKWDEFKKLISKWKK